MCNVKLKWVDLNFCVDQLKGELGVKKNTEAQEIHIVKQSVSRFFDHFAWSRKHYSTTEYKFHFALFYYHFCCGKQIKNTQLSSVVLVSVYVKTNLYWKHIFD